jgi:hypothetical protein
MKKVLVLIALVIAMGPVLIINAQPPISVTPKKTPTKIATSKPVAPKKQAWESIPTVNNLDFNQSGTTQTTCVTQPSISNAIDYRWVRKMINEKKYIITLTTYPNHEYRNSLNIVVQSPEAAPIIYYFNIASDISNPEVAQSGDWRKLAFKYESNGSQVVIEIENLN